MNSLKKNLVNGVFWSVSGKMSTLLISMGTNIWLARILSPREFGQLGIVVFFIIIANVLSEGGMAAALIRKKDATKLDYSTVFVFNLVVSSFFFLLLLVFSKPIAYFYNDPQLQHLLIAAGSILIINAFQTIQNAKLVSGLRFKQKSIYQFVAMLLSSAVGLVSVYLGLGVWSLVLMQIFMAGTYTVLLWVFEEFYVDLRFSKRSFKFLYAFGINTTLASLLDTGFDNIYQLVLGKYFSINQTGLYYQAKKLQGVPVGVIQSTTSSVLFSTLAKVQDNKSEFEQTYRRVVTLFTASVGFICLFIFFYAKNIVALLYGQEWLGAAFYMQVLIVASFFYVQEMFNRIIFKVYDRTEKILYLEITKKVIQAGTIVLGVVTQDIKLLLYGFVFTSILSYFMNYYQSRTIFGQFSWHEIFLVIKVLIISIITLFIGTLLENMLHLTGYYTIGILPVILAFYLIALKVGGVSNITQDLHQLVRLIKGNED